MTVLDAIAARKHDEVARLPRVEPETLSRSTRSFLDAIAAPGLSLIAEIKQRSPSHPTRPEGACAFDPAELARLYDRSARAISVLTDGPSFGGDPSYLGVASRESARPILCKDFVVDPSAQVAWARAHGADAILLMAQLLSSDAIERGLSLARGLGMECLVEVHDDDELSRVLGETSARVVGVNARDLRTLSIDLDRPRRMAERARSAGKWVIAESGLSTRDDVSQLEGVVDAILVGSAISISPDPARAITTLGFAPRPRAPAIKLCGIRSADQAQAAEALGVDAIGLNFVPGARRAIGADEASRVGAMALRCARVGVFVDPDDGSVRDAITLANLDAIQVHGCSPSRLTALATLARGHRVELVVAIEVDDGAHALDGMRAAASLGARVLLDGPRSGSGRSIERALLRGIVLPHDVALAGGLHPENVREAITRYEPALVDVASGIERDGEPSIERMTAFVHAVRG